MAQPYRVLIERSARKTVAKLDKRIRRRIQAALLSLAAEPRPRGVVALPGSRGALRVRVGDHRIVYTNRDQELLVLVIDVDHRGRAGGPD